MSHFWTYQKECFCGLLSQSLWEEFLRDKWDALEGKGWQLELHLLHLPGIHTVERTSSHSVPSDHGINSGILPFQPLGHQRPLSLKLNCYRKRESKIIISTTWDNHLAKERVFFSCSRDMVGWSQWSGPVGQTMKRADSKMKVFASWPGSQREGWDPSCTISLQGTTPVAWRSLTWLTS